MKQWKLDYLIRARRGLRGLLAIECAMTMACLSILIFNYHVTLLWRGNRGILFSSMGDGMFSIQCVWYGVIFDSAPPPKLSLLGLTVRNTFEFFQLEVSVLGLIIYTHLALAIASIILLVRRQKKEA